MVWLWLLVPIVLLGVAAALWRTTLRIDRERQALEVQRADLGAAGPLQARR